MNEIKLFEGNEVKVKTDAGKTLINLVHVAKCCGLVIKDNSRGTIRVNWNARNGVRDKLKKLCEANASQEIQEEINYILEEIENTDDRNTIYISSWLAKRLAVECHSERAMKFKNFLVSLDEARENNQLNNQTFALEQFAVATEQMAIIGQAVQGLQKMTIGIQEYVKDSIQAKDRQIDEIKELVGLRTKNTVTLVNRLKEVLSRKYNKNISGKSTEYSIAKNKIFSEFKVTKWEEIPVCKYNSVFAFIEEVI
ncbi:hypothetical protein [Clostridium thermobutyricum]|uniref:Uncharacterized protein n=1 Tax=Clostridium thermobutyricum DSM 4928 TaxID=1121339 RepID=A0A1V4SY60_9CLOT|nr:hypothetical protein [Clostridium thermobutyricum]OPX48521.1 hypothetical protein CLTHE_12000 [Clostridium thermobutyricum DSM 4928]